MTTESAQQHVDLNAVLNDSESALNTEYDLSAVQLDQASDQSIFDRTASHAAYEQLMAEILCREAPLDQVLRWDRERQPPLPVLNAMVSAGVFVSGVPIPKSKHAEPLANALLEAGLIAKQTLETLGKPLTESERQSQAFLAEIGCGGHARAMGIAAESTAKLAGVGIGTFMGVSTGLSAQTIFRVGTLAQRAFWLNALNQGIFTYGFALTEKNVGSDPRSITTTFAKETDAAGQPVYRLNGNKKFIGNAARVVDANGNVVHRGADFLLVFAVDDPRKSPKDRVFHCFMIPRERIGEENIRHSGGDHNKTGLREVNNGNFDLVDVIVPECCLLGTPDENMYPKLMGTLDVTRFLVGAMGVGTAEAALEIAVAYANERCQNGFPIARYPMVSFPLRELAARIVVGQLLVLESARLVDQADREQVELDEQLDQGLKMVDAMERGLEQVLSAHESSEFAQGCRQSLETCRKGLGRGGDRIKLKDRKSLIAEGVAALQVQTKRLRDTLAADLVETVKAVFRTSRELQTLAEHLSEPIRFGTETAMAKLYGSELAQKAIYQAIQTGPIIL